MRAKSLFVCFVFQSLGLLISCTAGADSSASLENDALRVVFSPDRGRLVSLFDQQNGYEHIEEAVGPGLWRVELRAPAGPDLCPEQAGAYAAQPLDNSGRDWELVWTDFGRAEAPDLRVVARVSLENGPDSTWHLEIMDIGKLQIHATHFPVLPRLSPRSGETLAAPAWMGEKTDTPRALLNAGGAPGRFEREYPGLLSLQCLAWYASGGPGLLLACDDTEAYHKRFAAFGDGAGAAGLEMVHYPETGNGADGYVLPYHARVGVFRGDWFDAALRYRAWALEQPWAAESRRILGRVPDWVGQTGLWVWNRGRSGNVLAPARLLQKRAGIPVSVFWHWWHGCAYDTGFPEYLPPREGEEPFREAVAAAAAQGIHAIVYMNQRLWGMNTESWIREDAARFAVKNPEGRIHPEVYNTFTKAPCASMCMGTEFWRGKYAGIAETVLRDCGVAGIYMDQACSSLACYDPTHGHPAGGGRYWIRGFQQLQADIRARAGADRAVALAGEGCGEAWLPYLDIMLSLQVSMERYAAPGQWAPIPFFHAVYHDRATMFGNYSSLTMPPYDDLWPAEFAPKEPLALLDPKFSHQFRIEQARAFVWGQQPSLANFKPELLEARPEEMDYVLRLARARLEVLPYLHAGVMLRPPVLAVPEEEIDVSRLSIYAGQQGALKEYRHAYPVALAGAWLSAESGVAVAVANVSDGSVTFPLELAPPEYPVPAHGRMLRFDGRTREDLGEFTEPSIHLTVNLGAQEIAVYTLAPE